MRIGWLQDTHTTVAGADSPGAQEELTDDYNYLDAVKDADIIVHGGDCVHPTDEQRPKDPHTTPPYYERFWELIDAADDPSLFEYAVPGNHDVPLATFVRSDERATLRQRVAYPEHNLSIFYINTHCPGIITGSPGTDSQGGVGTEVARISYRDLQWLDAGLADAESKGHTQLVIGHASPYFLDESGIPDASSVSSPSVMPQRSIYMVCSNYNAFHGVLSQYSNVVVPISHLYQFRSEGSQTIDGVRYVWKYHYTRNRETFETFGYIDIDGTHATITTVDHQTRNESVILDVQI